MFRVFSILMLVAGTCIGCYGPRSRVIERPRYLGDTYIVKTNPAPVVLATQPGLPEAVQSSEFLSIGFIENPIDRCDVVVELPPGSFEYAAQTTLGPCPETTLGSLVERGEVKYETYRPPLKPGAVYCRQWKPVTRLIVPSRTVSPLLRTPGGHTYKLAYTQTSRAGWYPFNGYQYLYVDHQQGNFLYRVATLADGGLPQRFSEVVDWAMTFNSCAAR